MQPSRLQFWKRLSGRSPTSSQGETGEPGGDAASSSLPTRENPLFARAASLAVPPSPTSTQRIIASGSAVQVKASTHLKTLVPFEVGHEDEMQGGVKGGVRKSAEPLIATSALRRISLEGYR